ncbi:MAG: twin-arginine translocase TatA/TatE family subunit [Coriobacteriia bacterium]|nr:twin-arginine translocase TatA/TatE family subunit [Coriobacteriia bacterium]MCL2536932.1 twin-arginine translocase TatA/TatE family subunit [Coriobacteriia bacterium]
MISGPELVVIVIVALLLFGPDKIPEILKTVKKAMGMYAEARDQVQEVVTTQIISPEELEMLKDPLGLGAKGTTGTKDLLSPERQSLYKQTVPTPAIHEVAPANLTATSDFVDASEQTPAEAVIDSSYAEQPAHPSPEAATSLAAETPAAVAAPTAAVVQPPVAATPAAVSSSSAGSIWASLESAAAVPAGDAGQTPQSEGQGS